MIASGGKGIKYGAAFFIPNFPGWLEGRENVDFYTLLIFLRQRAAALPPHGYLLIMKYCRPAGPFGFTASSCRTRCERLPFLSRCIKVKVGKSSPSRQKLSPVLCHRCQKGTAGGKIARFTCDGPP